MKIKTNDLIDAPLDWAVAVADGYDSKTDGRWVKNLFTPSTDWAQGGPIIEREQINVVCRSNKTWLAYNHVNAETQANESGPTPLVAAMRCYVASKMGDEIEVSEALT